MQLGLTPLLIAMCSGGDFCEELISKGADVNSLYAEESMLAYAVRFKNIKLCITFLTKGAAVDGKVNHLDYIVAALLTAALQMIKGLMLLASCTKSKESVELCDLLLATANIPVDFLDDVSIRYMPHLLILC